MKAWLRKGLAILFGLLILGGLSMAGYPFLAKIHNQSKALSVIEQYEKSQQIQSSESAQKQLEAAHKLNEYLAASGFRWEWQNEASKEYEEVLPLDDDVAGSIEIPAIHVLLPIYKGTSESNLRLGAGHLPGTSLPVGGNSTHSVITGHTGLPTARLFSDVDQLKEKDRILIHVLGQTLAYEVISRRVVLPEETDSLKIVENEDLLTLVTCTPYGINSHRLLVTAKRIPWQPEEKPDLPEILQVSWKPVWQACILSGMAISLCLFILWRHKRKKEKS